MKKAQVSIGEHYVAKISGRLTVVRLDSINNIWRHNGRSQRFNGWKATNMRTGREVAIRSAAKLRSRVTEHQLAQTNMRKWLGTDGVDIRSAYIR
jgi:hypothetical protein